MATFLPELWVERMSNPFGMSDKDIQEWANGTRLFNLIGEICDRNTLEAVCFAAMKFYSLACIQSTNTEPEAHEQAENYIIAVHFIISNQYKQLKDLGSTEPIKDQSEPLQ